MRTATISYELVNAWELWKIEILDPNAPEDISEEWLEENPDGWYYLDLEDRGGKIKDGSWVVEDQD